MQADKIIDHIVKWLKDYAIQNSGIQVFTAILCYFAQLNGYLVDANVNKVEDYSIGYFTKYGNGRVDINPIDDLLKSEVRALARELGATYDELEWAVKQYEKENIDEQMTEREEKVMNIFLQRHQSNMHKMKAIPICIIPKEFKQST
ncbi:unnamed protein product [Rotaria sp. Silwood2]|nr:unnamed protein product [Rotaria sp. Silwood2]